MLVEAEAQTATITTTNNDYSGRKRKQPYSLLLRLGDCFARLMKHGRAAAKADGDVGRLLLTRDGSGELSMTPPWSPRSGSSLHVPEVLHRDSFATCRSIRQACAARAAQSCSCCGAGLLMAGYNWSEDPFPHNGCVPGRLRANPPSALAEGFPVRGKLLQLRR